MRLSVHSNNDDGSFRNHQVAALEESLWRLASATDKVDAIVSLAFAGKPFKVVADDAFARGAPPPQSGRFVCSQVLGDPEC